MIIDEDGYLEHYGKKGMQWGVRKDDDGDPGKSAREEAVLKKVDPGGRLNSELLRSKYGMESSGGSKTSAKPTAKTTSKKKILPKKKDLLINKKKQLRLALE